jgi:tRNA wybutosine-synthesizing protein 4
MYACIKHLLWASSQRVIEWAARTFAKGGCVMATYEQIRPDDAFGRTMLANLESRGCPLLGLRSHPTLESQQVRFLSRGWSVARALDMNDVYRRFLPAADVKRIERLELWDEFEEWNMIQAHYCIAMACRHGDGPGASNYLSKVGYLDLAAEASSSSAALD